MRSSSPNDYLRSNIDIVTDLCPLMHNNCNPLISKNNSFAENNTWRQYDPKNYSIKYIKNMRQDWHI